MFVDMWSALPAKLKLRLIIGAALAVGLSSVAVANTLTATDLNPLGAGNESIDLASNTFVDDTEAVITRIGFAMAGTGIAAAGTSSPGVEAAPTTFTLVNNTIVEGNWNYRFSVAEALDGDWVGTREYKVEVFGETAGSTSLLTTLYWENDTDGAGVEGVEVAVDLGSGTIVPDSFSIIVTRAVN